jgi:hypothetical protein
VPLTLNVNRKNMNMKTWTDSEYEDMCWHDNNVYGIQIKEGEFGTGTLVLELDYILEWLKPNETEFKFRIAPAQLSFIDVFDLKLELDYETPTAAITPFCISEISRENIGVSGSKYYKWTIGINWPDGAISFKASGFRQILTGAVIETDKQILTNEQRIKAINSG